MARRILIAPVLVAAVASATSSNSQMTLPRASVVVIVSLLLVEKANADCVGAFLHQHFAGAEKVFLGQVLEVTDAGVVFDVREAFKKAKTGVVTHSFRLSSEGHYFRPGELVLVLAFRYQGALTTACSGTRVVEHDDRDLTIVRHLARREPGGTVEGGLTRFDYGWNRYPGVRITLRPLSGVGRGLSSVTGPRGGGFRFDWVPPGNYVVLLQGPSGVKNQERRIRVSRNQKHLLVPPFIISAEEHPLIADRDDQAAAGMPDDSSGRPASNVLTSTGGGPRTRDPRTDEAQQYRGPGTKWGLGIPPVVLPSCSPFF